MLTKPPRRELVGAVRAVPYAPARTICRSSAPPSSGSGSAGGAPGGTVCLPLYGSGGMGGIINGGDQQVCFPVSGVAGGA